MWKIMQILEAVINKAKTSSSICEILHILFRLIQIYWINIYLWIKFSNERENN